MKGCLTILYEIIPDYIWVEFHPQYNPTNQGIFRGSNNHHQQIQKQCPYHGTNSILTDPWMLDCYCKLVGTYIYIQSSHGWFWDVYCHSRFRRRFPQKQATKNVCFLKNKVPRELTYISHLGTKKNIFKRKIYNSFAKKYLVGVFNPFEKY